MATPTTKPNAAPRLPTAEQLAAATATREAIDRDAKGNASAGTVIDLDYEQWASAIVDTTDADKREDIIAKERRRMEGKGYVRLEGDWRVNGFPNAEVWVKTRAQYNIDREKRVQKQREMVRARQMSETTFATERLHTGGNYGT